MEMNLIETDFLDVTFNLHKNKYLAVYKTNNDLLYINMQANHPRLTWKELPKMIIKRISGLSWSKEEFNIAELIDEKL